MKKDNDDFENSAAFALPIAYFERDVKQTKRSASDLQAANDGVGDEPSFLEPVAYYDTGARPARRAAAHNAAEDDQPFIAPRPYFVSNEMLDLDELRQLVLRAMAKMDRTPAASVERLEAERELISAKANLRTAARSRASELEAQVAAMKQPGANDLERSRLERELSSVNDLLRMIETEDLPSKAANTIASTAAPQATLTVLNSWQNARGELVELTDAGLRISDQPPQRPESNRRDEPVEGSPVEGSPEWYRIQLNIAARRASAMSDEELMREIARGE
jgi:hypothetical protein